jgi:hypothetical protein
MSDEKLPEALTPDQLVVWTILVALDDEIPYTRLASIAWLANKLTTARVEHALQELCRMKLATHRTSELGLAELWSAVKPNEQ